MAKPRDYSFTFGGAGEQYVLARGKYVQVLATPSADAFFSLDNGSELQRGAGQEIADSDPKGFARIDVRSTVAQTVRFSVSDVPQRDSRSNVALSVTATVTPGNNLSNGGDVSLLAGVATQILAADATRLSATIDNPATNTQTMRIGGAGVAAATGMPLAPGESITIATTSAISGFNPGAGAETVSAFAVQDI